MPLKPKQVVYLDDLLYEYKLLLSAAIDKGEIPQSDRLVDPMQKLVRDFRNDHPAADAGVPYSVGKNHRPERPADNELHTVEIPRWPHDDPWA